MQPAGYSVIPLYRRNGQVAVTTRVDDSDYLWLSAWRWCQDSKGYACRFETVDGIHRKRLMHRVILQLTSPDVHVDHINGDRLDNRRQNLRRASHSENLQNRSRLNRNNRSGYRGVYWAKDKQRWRVVVRVDRRVYRLGYFADVHEAGAVATDFYASRVPFSAEARMQEASEAAS